MLILFIYSGLWRRRVPGNMNSYIFCTAWTFMFTFRIHVCNLPKSWQTHESHDPKDGGWWPVIFYLQFWNTKSSEAEMFLQTPLVAMPELYRSQANVVLVPLVWIVTYFATQETLLGVVRKMQCVHHIALLKCKIFCIPNHIWSQSLWIRECKPLLIWADFFHFNYVFCVNAGLQMMWNLAIKTTDSPCSA